MLQLHRFCSFSLLLFFVGFCAPDAAWCPNNSLHEAQEKLRAVNALYADAVASEKQVDQKVKQLADEVAQFSRLSGEGKQPNKNYFQALQARHSDAKKAQEKAREFKAKMDNERLMAMNALLATPQIKEEKENARRYRARMANNVW